MRIRRIFAVTVGPEGVVSDPVIEIGGDRIKSTSSQRGLSGHIHVDGIIVPGLISTHTHLHGLVA